MHSWINGKTIVLTGASSGLGKILTTLLINNNGCTIYGIGRNSSRLEKLKEELGSKGNNLKPVIMDVSDENDWIKFSGSLCSSVDGIISCAGILPEMQSVICSSPCETAKVMGTNFYSFVYAKTHLKDKLSCNFFMVTVSSLAALAAIPGSGSYSASKAAVKSYMESLQCELKNNYISLVMPGFADTNIFREQSPDEKESRLIKHFSMDADKMAGKIYRGILRKKRRMVIGADAKLLSLLYRISPGFEAWAVTIIFKKSGLGIFNKVFH